MSKLKTNVTEELNAYFLPEGFIIDEIYDLLSDTLKTWKTSFDDDKYAALFHLGFLNKEKWFGPSIEYLHHITEIFIKKLSQLPEIELTREMTEVELTNDELYKLKEVIKRRQKKQSGNCRNGYRGYIWLVKCWHDIP